MEQENLENSVKDDKKLMTRQEIIKYLEKRRTELYGENDEESYYLQSPAKVSDFIRIAWDSPY